MEKAKEILSKRGMNISEVAYEVGYKNPQHFTVAFKKYFGYVPSKLK
jgi:AraC-like DNA-binding protein